jgi:hypothetical protein
MWFKAGIGFALVFALTAAAWWLGARLDLLDKTQVELALVKDDRDDALKDLRQAKSELAAERQARLLDAQEGTADFEKADWACQDTIKRVVAARAIKPVPRQYLTPEGQTNEVETSNRICPDASVPDLYRLRDVQTAGSDRAN